MKGRHHQDLVRKAQRLAPLLTAIVHPVQAVSLQGSIEATKGNLIIPVLVGPKIKIRAAAKMAGLDISCYELVPTEHSHAAAAAPVLIETTRLVPFAPSDPVTSPRRHCGFVEAAPRTKRCMQ